MRTISCLYEQSLAAEAKALKPRTIRHAWLYYKMQESERADGWFFTGDVATVDGDGYMQVTDRSKDVIKSGGEWISSIELENLAMAQPRNRRSGGDWYCASKMGRTPARACSPTPGIEA
jgi:acyl-CoA synthetase (AMP-forming)/AMP-acid ligase II